jgi:hypothetical protein
MNAGALHDHLHGAWGHYHNHWGHYPFGAGWWGAGWHHMYHHHPGAFWTAFGLRTAAWFVGAGGWYDNSYGTYGGGGEYYAPVSYYQEPIYGDTYTEYSQPVTQLISYGESASYPAAEQQVWVNPSQLEQSAPPPQDANVMGLGIFGLMPNGSNRFVGWVQLTVSKEGAVRGYQVEAVSNKTSEVTGGVDKATLIIAWQSTGAAKMMFETSLDEITKDQFLVNAFDIAKKEAKAWQAVRVKDFGETFDVK